MSTVVRTKDDNNGEEQICCTHEATLKTLEPELEALRQLITCKICQRFLSEPYGLACGHTYCYICLDTWLISQKKRTCPECRAKVQTEPAPSYVIKEMVHVFSRRQEMLSNGETVEEVDTHAKEAAEKVTADRGSDGKQPLFKGLFVRPDFYGHAVPWHDEEDGVDRCPYCGHEVEDGRCSNESCFHHTAGWDSDDELDYELGLEGVMDDDDDDDDSDDDDSDESDPHHQYHHRFGTVESGTSSSDDDDDSSEMDGFVVNDQDDLDPQSEHSDTSSSDSAQETFTTAIAARASRRNNRHILSDSDSDEESDGSAGSNITLRQQSALSTANRATARSGTARQRKHGAAALVVLSDSDSSSSEDDSDEELSDSDQDEDDDTTNTAVSTSSQAVSDDEDDAAHDGHPYRPDLHGELGPEAYPSESETSYGY